MLNKRAAKLLALVLAGSMMLSGPSASLALASSGDSKETSQTEAKEKKSESADSVKDKSSEKKKAKKQASGNSISSAKGKIAEEDDEDLPRAGVSDDSVSGNVSQGDASPTPTVTSTPTVSATDTPTPTVSATDTPTPTVSATDTPTPTVSATDTPTPTVSATDTPTASDQQAKKEDNGIFGIKTRYASGDTVEFYAIGAGLGPNEPQTIAPINGATRYRPYQWSVADLSRTWDKNDGVSENGIYCYKAAFEVQTSETKSYTLKVDYQKEIYNGKDWKKATSEGAVVSKTEDFYVNGGSDDPIPDQQADPTQNGLYWINEGATYRSGASLQFYATGDGYGPDEVQESDPVAGATRYVPVSWSVTATNGGATGASGTWAKRNREETRGSSSGNAYTSGEYRFKGSFVLSTNLTTSVPYTLQVNYQREVYGGRKWKTDNASLATKSVNFYIRNTALTTTTPRPTSSYYNRSGVTSTAARSNISSNARNASTEDNTPIGALMLLMMAAAGSGLVIFRKKQNRS